MCDQVHEPIRQLLVGLYHNLVVFPSELMQKYQMNLNCPNQQMQILIQVHSRRQGNNEKFLFLGCLDRYVKNNSNINL